MQGVEPTLNPRMSMSTHSIRKTISTRKGTSFRPARAKLWIGSLDRPKVTVQAQYNPKELQYTKSLEWTPARSLNGTEAAAEAGGGSDENRSDLEIHSPPTRTMTIELLFDGYEEGVSVEGDVQTLEQLSTLEIVEQDGKAKPRAHHCIVAWGSTSDGMRPFPCVITSLTTKYSMWSTDGKPLRATCTVELKGAHKMAGAVAPKYTYLERNRSRRRR
jgi:hypothetical protein